MVKLSPISSDQALSSLRSSLNGPNSKVMAPMVFTLLRGWKSPLSPISVYLLRLRFFIFERRWTGRTSKRGTKEERCHVDYIICPVAGPARLIPTSSTCWRWRRRRFRHSGCFNATHKKGSEDIIIFVITSQRCVKSSYVLIFLSAYYRPTATLHHNATFTGLPVKTSSRPFIPHPLASKPYIASTCHYSSQSQSADSPSSDKYALQEILSIRSS